MRRGFLQLYFFFLPHIGKGSDYSIPSLGSLCTVHSSFEQWSNFAWVFVPQGKQLKVLLHPYVRSDGFHAPDCMDGIESRC